MPKTSAAYRLAERIHAPFFSPASNLTDEERALSGIQADTSTTLQIEMLAVVGADELVCQFLTKSQRTGYFMLSSYFRDSPKLMATITPDSSFEMFPIVASTLFMERMMALAEARQQQP